MRFGQRSKPEAEVILQSGDGRSPNRSALDSRTAPRDASDAPLRAPSGAASGAASAVAPGAPSGAAADAAVGTEAHAERTPSGLSGSAGPSATALLEGLSVFYGEVLGLSRVDLSIGPGITGIVGPNGSGKSTLMRVLTGLVSPSEGRATVFGREPFGSPDARRRTALVPATEAFHDGLSARRNLEIAFLARGSGRADARERASRSLEQVGLTADAERRYGTWSRGMRQRLKLAFVLGSDADLVLLDEPFLGVDPPSRRSLRLAIAALGTSGRTVLLSSHVLHDIESLTRRVGVLAHGRLLGFGEIDTILRDLRDRHPHRVRVEADEPRALASALAGLAHIRELRLEPGALEFLTTEPETAYRDLAAMAAGVGSLVRRVQTLDDGLEAVYRQVAADGAGRL